MSEQPDALTMENGHWCDAVRERNNYKAAFANATVVMRQLSDENVALRQALDESIRHFDALLHTLRPYRSSWVSKVCSNARLAFERVREAATRQHGNCTYPCDECEPKP